MENGWTPDNEGISNSLILAHWQELVSSWECERQGAGSVYCGGSWLSTGVYSSI